MKKQIAKKKVLKKETAMKVFSQKIDTLTDTIDSLAAITSAGFVGVNVRLDKVETCIAKVETRLDGVEQRLGKIESGRIDALEDKMRIPSTAFENKLKIKLPK